MVTTLRSKRSCAGERVQDATGAPLLAPGALAAGGGGGSGMAAHGAGGAAVAAELRAVRTEIEALAGRRRRPAAARWCRISTSIELRELVRRDDTGCRRKEYVRRPPAAWGAAADRVAPAAAKRRAGEAQHC